MSTRYDDIFVPPFEPWATSAAAGSAISGPDGILEEAADVNNGAVGGGGKSAVDGETAASAGTSWFTLPETVLKESDDCLLNLTTGGA